MLGPCCKIREFRTSICHDGVLVMADYTDDLAAAENSLRRVIERVGRDAHGDQWLKPLGITEKEIKKWEGHRERENVARSAGIQEQRLIYFADFADLKDIIEDKWPLFEPVFINRDQTLIFLDKLRELRNPDADHQE